ncbi:polysaccharide biosynthesis/export family protein [Gelidibacter salicanalis]|uniref:Polysaccharide biosynthesis/export family protein n=1 Tax=Gelidibacter salicanalis TaxID=291193 RepID=A0A934KVC8_9FLAO|nr:polysaccharide biosynthesis/export family protein [Gelidibacter salicanalis]MBJ7882695.1 polysaccharide biosynthesis/export family protein [Gelidibacter salicanalis]
MKTHIFIISILALAFASSCASRKDLVYFQDEPLSGGYIDSTPEQLIYKPDDILTINVSAADPIAAKPFNLSVVSESDDLVRATGSTRMQTYLIDFNGNIEFPVLGTLHIAGMTRIELTNMLKEKISAYAKDPIINVRLVNFTVTVIGEVADPGTFTIQDERITLLEALGLANDLTIFGQRKNVLLIREVDGKKRFAKMDLTSVNSVSSPLYYLQQNDVIVVEPNNSRIRSSTYNQNNSVLISAIGTLTTILAVFLIK